MSNLVTRMLSAATEPLIRPRVTSIFEPGQDLQPGAPSWLRDADEGLAPQLESASRVPPRVEGPAEPTRPIAASAAGPVSVERQGVVPRGNTVDSAPLDLGPMPRASQPAERVTPTRDLTTDVPTPAARRPVPALSATEVEPPVGPGLATVVTTRAPETNAPPQTAATAPPERGTPHTRATTADPSSSRVEAPVAALPSSHPVKATFATPPATAIPASSRRTTPRASEQQDSVQVTIGRVEVRASRSSEHRPPTAAAAEPNRRPLLSLEDYLRRRSGGVSA